MSWKDDVISTLQLLAQDIRKIRDALNEKAGGEVSVGPQLGVHIAQLMEVVGAIDETEYEEIVEDANAVKKLGIPLMQAVSSRNVESTEKLFPELAAKVKKLNESTKNAKVTPASTGKTVKTESVVESSPQKQTPTSSGGGGGGGGGAKTKNEGSKKIDMEQTKNICDEMKNNIIVLNRAYKSGDKSQSDEGMQKLLDQCKDLCHLGTGAGCDVKKTVRVPLRKIETLRAEANADEQFQAALKELHKVVKDIEKTYKMHNQKAGSSPAPPKKPKSPFEVELAQLQSTLDKHDPTELFTLTKELGKGAFGSVHAAVTRNNKVYAIKKVPLSAKTLAATNKEIKFMRSIQHENTLAYYSCYKKGNDVWIVMELCDGGSVQNILDKTGKGLEEKHIAAITGQVLNGLAYLHGLEKIHRDIKSGNLLLTGEGKVKIADFGTSADGVNRTTVIGSSYWMAPETLDQRGYDAKADIWSLGITLIEMAEKDPPFFNLEPQEVVRQLMTSPPPTLKQPNKWSNHFREFVRYCLQRDPAKRLDAKTLQQHPFVLEADHLCLRELIIDMVEKKKEEVPGPVPVPSPAPESQQQTTTSSETATSEIKKSRKSTASSSSAAKTESGSQRRGSSSETGKRKSQKRSESAVGEAGERVKVHLNTTETTAKRITIDPSADVTALSSKCRVQFKIPKEEAVTYSLYIVSSGSEKKLSDEDLPLSLVKEKKDAYFIYKRS